MAIHDARGCCISCPSYEGFAEAVQLAKASELVILVIGGKLCLNIRLHLRRTARPPPIEAARLARGAGAGDLLLRQIRGAGSWLLGGHTGTGPVTAGHPRSLGAGASSMLKGW